LNAQTFWLIFKSFCAIEKILLKMWNFFVSLRVLYMRGKKVMRKEMVEYEEISPKQGIQISANAYNYCRTWNNRLWSLKYTP
jgi:hypothetical protein